jgi:tetratricopeptide repeat protein 30
MLSLIENMAKHMLILRDTSMSDILNFLDAADEHGKKIQTEIKPLEAFDERKTVSFEARELKRLFIKLRG